MTFSDIFKNGFLNSYANTEITFSYAVASMAICTLIAAVIWAVYYFKSRQYFFSREFAVSLVALAEITTAVILTIQSSIVVSLGMVGALSIVRFRTAVKNPLDLVFLFWAISVGIISGAGLYYIAIALTLIVSLVVLLSDEIPGLPSNRLLVLDGFFPFDRAALEQVLRSHTRYWNVRTESLRGNEVNLLIEVRGVKDTAALLDALRALGSFHSISVLVQEGTVE